MTLYRIRFELRSAIITPLKGDTIWGHIVWGIANHEGDEAVEKFLEQEKSDTPELVVSSAFPAGMICKPLPTPKDRNEELSISKYSEIKKNKKIKYVSASEYFDNAENSDEVKEEPLKTVQVMHNTIDRITNTVVDSGLYPVEEKWPQSVNWDFYVLSVLPTDRIKQLTEWAFENGYGADASTGKGRIHITSEPVPVKLKKQGNSYMALGPFVDSKNNLSNIRADIFVRSGKVGGAFAVSLSPYKKPVVLYDEGAVFTSNQPIDYAGVLLTNMHGGDSRICQSGFAPVIPI
ncbi:MAG: hypothetical protein LBR68_02600 [Lachnoclostridium sp.]|jgi:CRISPR-associated protein Csm4|nr:hypothetical protein [Lachnoclostridium sp.]